LTFENPLSAERFQDTARGPRAEETTRMSDWDETGRHFPTVTEWPSNHIGNRNGIQPATIQRYRTAVARDVTSWPEACSDPGSRRRG
jgi:integrase